MIQYNYRIICYTESPFVITLGSWNYLSVKKMNSLNSMELTSSAKRSVSLNSSCAHAHASIATFSLFFIMLCLQLRESAYVLNQYPAVVT